MSKPDFDIYLGDRANMQGFMVRSFVRDSAPQIGPRFSSGEEGQTNLDLLKVKTLSGVAGGMFQREWKDEQQAAYLLGMHNQFDNNFYPFPALKNYGGSTPFSYTGSSDSITAKAESALMTFVAHREGSTNALYKIDNNGTPSKITLPSAISSSTSPITSLVFHGDYLFISGEKTYNSIYFNDYRYNYNNNTFQDIGGNCTLLRELRGVLYHIKAEADIFLVTNEYTSAATFTLVDRAGFSDNTQTAPREAVELNGALWIAKYDGIFRFDGTKAVKVLNHDAYFMTLFNGALYYIYNGWLWRFDGLNVEKLQYFGNGDKVRSMGVAGDYLCILTRPNALYPYASVDTDLLSVNRLYAYNGQGMYRIFDDQYTTELFEMIASCNDRLIVWTLATASATAITFSANLLELFQTTTDYRGSEIITSEFDAGYANIYKSLEKIQVDFVDMKQTDDGAMTPNFDKITVSINGYTDDGWSGWTVVGTINPGDSNLVKLSDSDIKLFKRVKIKIRLSRIPDSSLSFKAVSLFYVVQPRYRNRWVTMLQAYGNGAHVDRNNNAIDTDANALNNMIMKSVRSKTPVYLFGPDYSAVKTGIDADDLVIVLQGQIPLYSDPYGEHQLLAVLNDNSVWEILRVSSAVYSEADQQTTVTVLERGYLDITPGTISSNAETRLAYEITVNRLSRDAVILQDDVYNQQPTGESQVQREFLLELVEL